MRAPSLLLALSLALIGAATAAVAADIRVEGAFARASTMMSKSGAAFMVIHNDGAEDDRLIAAHADVAERVELHTHRDMGGGVMRMVEVQEGFALPAGGSHALARGGDHVMFLGLRAPFAEGASFPLTLVFERGGAVVIEVPVSMQGAQGHAMPASGTSTGTN